MADIETDKGGAASRDLLAVEPDQVERFKAMGYTVTADPAFLPPPGMILMRKPAYYEGRA